MNVVNTFKKIAILEGISYLLLLFIAMPLKYWADMPLYVKYTGWAHGLLFVLYMVFFVMCWYKLRWPFWKAAMIGAASLLPFAPFYVEKKLVK